MCGLSGKWHLGANLTPQEGFSSWITMPHGHTTEFYDVPVIENGQERKEPKYLTDLWTEHGVRFIEQNKDRPFFLYLAYNGPYCTRPTAAQPRAESACGVLRRQRTAQLPARRHASLAIQ